MKVNLTYVFDTKDGFRYERETPSEILKIARENIEEEDIAILRAKTSKAYKAHLTPDCYCDTDKVIELLGEYGEENDLEESWWEDYADINDIIFELIK